jgi:dUTP pyrophosphatase
MTNLGDQTIVFEQGDRIAQLVLNLVPKAQVIDVNDAVWEHLCNTERGEGGFGSTGV